MGKIKDLTGKRFGKLLVENLVGYNKHGSTMWKCKCDCGNEKAISSSQLNIGRTKSCGCLQKKLVAERMTKHGLSKTKSYRLYMQMRDRCYNPCNKDYKNWGGQGIGVHECIPNVVVYHNYISSLENAFKPGYSIDRINPYGNYCICTNNLRWATPSEQLINQRNRDNNTGHRGIWFDKKRNKFCVSIGINNQHIHLGRRNTIEEAVKLRKDSELKYWGFNI